MGIRRCPRGLYFDVTPVQSSTWSNNSVILTRGRRAFACRIKLIAYWPHLIVKGLRRFARTIANKISDTQPLI